MRLALLIVFSFLISPAAFAQLPVYTVPNTEIFELRSEAIDQTYEIRVALPDSYGMDDREYPLLILLDADYSFAIARNVTQHLAQRNQLPEMIVVAIAYPSAEGNTEHYRMTRSRDYTPVYNADGGYGGRFQVNSGGGPAFLDFIGDELIPELERRYPLHPRDRTLSGHSYGGLFTTWAMFARPELFARYVIISASYWYGPGFIYDYENAFSEGHERLDAVAFITVGLWENQPQNGRAMVDEMHQLVDQIRSHDYEGLSLDPYVFGEETHASIWPAGFSRGMRSVFNEPLPGENVEGE